MSNDFSLEEYKFAKEKLRRNEDKRYALITLNITAFAGLLGFSQKMPGLAFPLSMASVLVICSSLYNIQSQIQRHTTAFIIEVYESHIDKICYETEINAYRYHDTPRSRVVKAAGAIYWLAKDTFFLLFMLSVSSTFVLSSESIFKLVEKNGFSAIVYIGVLIGLYLVAIKNIFSRRNDKLQKYRDYWKKHAELHNQKIQPT